MSKASDIWNEAAAPWIKRSSTDRKFKRLIADELMRRSPGVIYWPQEIGGWLSADVERRVEPKYGVGLKLLRACECVFGTNEVKKTNMKKQTNRRKTKL